MFFRQFKAVFKSSFRICAGDPFYLVISLTMLAIMALAASMPSIGNEHNRLVRDQTHSILFICAALAGAFGLIRVVTDDMRRGAAAILMSRPISGMVLMSGKLCGVIACVALLTLSGGAASLWISEINHHSEKVATASLLFFLLAIFVALGAGAARQYMFGTSFSKYTTGALAMFLTLGVVLRYFTGNKAEFDVPGLQSIILLFGALVIFCSVVMVFAVIADSALVLGFAVLVFFFGLLSEYLCSTVIGGAFGNILASIVPNWQIFWVLEKIGAGETIPTAYFFKCGLHVFLTAFMYLNIAVVCFDKSEVKGVA